MNNKVKAVDIYVQSTSLPKVEVSGWKCTDVFNRGTKVGPEVIISGHLSDIFQCRFTHEGGMTTNSEVVSLLKKITDSGFTWCELHLIWAD
jgi:hypothetical protein